MSKVLCVGNPPTSLISEKWRSASCIHHPGKNILEAARLSPMCQEQGKRMNL